MKTNLLFKTVFVITCLLSQLNLWAQDAQPVTVNVVTAGTLPSLISESSKYEITNLTLTGDLNGTDIRFIREMAGVDINEDATEGKLTTLNLADVNIVEGGETYFETDGVYHTSKNDISECMFSFTKIKNITIPNSVTHIDGSAFYSCLYLENFMVSKYHQIFSDVDGVLFNKNKTTLMSYPLAKIASSYIIPNSVTYIRDGSFAQNVALTSITIPNSVTMIGNYAFAECKGLTNIVIPNSVTEILFGAFQNCTRLTSIVISNNVTMLEGKVFWGCVNLTEIYSQNTTPPSLGEDCFTNVDKTTTKLYVPKGSKEAYSTAAGWSEFTNIIEKDFTSINNISNNNVSIQSIENGIAIETTEATNISVFNITGLKVYQSIVNGYKEVALDKGVYIVSTNNNSQTVIVK
ncbi:hypothetical protein M2138_001173 [Dysgonomonadaceae bacterium PH5-43]|nr:hypothetical protein [Dysgonomonadaceae bacterium PH5-43]